MFHSIGEEEEFRKQHGGKDYHTVFMGVCYYCDGLFTEYE